MIHRKSNEARQAILKRLRASSPHNWHDKWPGEPTPGSVFPEVVDLLGQFKDELESLGGQVISAAGMPALLKKLKSELDKRALSEVFIPEEKLRDELGEAGISFAGRDWFNDDFQVGITRCEVLVALTGSVLVSSAGAAGRRANVFPPVHVVLAGHSQLVATIDDGFEMVEKIYAGTRPSQITLISGPSRTADIEKTLVMGAHGPRELIVMIDING